MTATVFSYPVSVTYRHMKKQNDNNGIIPVNRKRHTTVVIIKLKEKNNVSYFWKLIFQKSVLSY